MDDWKLKATPVVILKMPNKMFVYFVHAASGFFLSVYSRAGKGTMRKAEYRCGMRKILETAPYFYKTKL